MSPSERPKKGLFSTFLSYYAGQTHLFVADIIAAITVAGIDLTGYSCYLPIGRREKSPWLAANGIFRATSSRIWLLPTARCS